jgi:hypothetical protein
MSSRGDVKYPHECYFDAFLGLSFCVVCAFVSNHVV